MIATGSYQEWMRVAMNAAKYGIDLRALKSARAGLRAGIAPHSPIAKAHIHKVEARNVLRCIKATRPAWATDAHVELVLKIIKDALLKPSNAPFAVEARP